VRRNTMVLDLWRADSSSQSGMDACQAPGCPRRPRRPRRFRSMYGEFPATINWPA
jgi:hypothetical protein